MDLQRSSTEKSKCQQTENPVLSQGCTVATPRSGPGCTATDESRRKKEKTRLLSSTNPHPVSCVSTDSFAKSPALKNFDLETLKMQMHTIQGSKLSKETKDFRTGEFIIRL